MAASGELVQVLDILHAARNIDASSAIMRGDAEPMRKMLDTLVTDET